LFCLQQSNENYLQNFSVTIFFFLVKRIYQFTVQEEWLSNLEKLNQEIIHLKSSQTKTQHHVKKNYTNRSKTIVLPKKSRMGIGDIWPIQRDL
jgi:hypothetical protein